MAGKKVSSNAFDFDNLLSRRKKIHYFIRHRFSSKTLPKFFVNCKIVSIT